jgi:hypothetical protein
VESLHEVVFPILVELIHVETVTAEMQVSTAHALLEFLSSFDDETLLQVLVECNYSVMVMTKTDEYSKF